MHTCILLHLSCKKGYMCSRLTTPPPENMEMDENELIDFFHDLKWQNAYLTITCLLK